MYHVALDPDDEQWVELERFYENMTGTLFIGGKGAKRGTNLVKNISLVEMHLFQYLGLS